MDKWSYKMNADRGGLGSSHYQVYEAFTSRERCEMNESATCGECGCPFCDTGENCGDVNCEQCKGRESK